jgi:hypothetical protein
LQTPARNGEGLAQVPSDLVVQAVRELLKTDFGASRSSVTAAYDKLTPEQLKPLWKDIYQAVRVQAYADTMFSAGARTGGLKLMAKNHTREGLETAVWLLTNQKPHGAKEVTREALDIIVKTYGGHAKSQIPQLEKAAKYLGESKFYNSPEQATAVREAIKEIEKAPTPTWPMTSIAQYLK